MSTLNAPKLISPSATTNQLLTPLDAEEAFVRGLAKNLKYREFFRRSQKFPLTDYQHFFLSQELRSDYQEQDFEDVDLSSLALSASNTINSTESASINVTSKPPSGLRKRASSRVSKHSSKGTKAAAKKANFILEFSRDGKYLASAGDDGCVRIWEVISSAFDRHSNAVHLETSRSGTVGSSTTSGLTAPPALDRPTKSRSRAQSTSSFSASLSPSGERFSGGQSADDATPTGHSSAFAPVFKPTPVRMFHHDDTILSVSWSKNNFLLTSSEDKTIKLWHVDKRECLRTFKLNSIATAVQFHDKDDRFFICCQWDGKVLFYSILEDEIQYEARLSGHQITCMTLSPDLEQVYVGCERGYFHVLELIGLKEVSCFQIRHKNVCPRITGVESFLRDNDTKVLVTTNDSCVRLFSLKNSVLEVRYSGYNNEHSMISASVDEDRCMVISGSEDGWIYMWRIYDGKSSLADLDSSRLKKLPMEIASWFKDESCLLKNKRYGGFHVHRIRCNAAIFAPRTTLKLLELGNDPIFELHNRYADLGPDKPDGKPIDLSSSIVVSTDNNGTIRVLRRDFAHSIRKAVLSRKGPCKEGLRPALSKIFQQRKSSISSYGTSANYLSVANPSKMRSVSALTAPSTPLTPMTPMPPPESRGRAKSGKGPRSRRATRASIEATHRVSSSPLKVLTINDTQDSSASSLRTNSRRNSAMMENSNSDDYQAFKEIDQQIRSMMVDTKLPEASTVSLPSTAATPATKSNVTPEISVGTVPGSTVCSHCGKRKFRAEGSSGTKIRFFCNSCGREVIIN